MTASPSWCTGNTPNWEDRDGDGCDWNEEKDKPGCPNYGWKYRGNMGVADDNCCYYFGTAVSIIVLEIHSHRYYSHCLELYFCMYSRFLPPFPLKNIQLILLRWHLLQQQMHCPHGVLGTHPTGKMVVVMDVIGTKKRTSQAAPTMVRNKEAIWV